MKSTITIFFFFLLSTSCFSQNEDFIVKNSGDTIYGEVKYTRYSHRKGGRFKLKTASGEKHKFDPSSAKLVHYEDADHILMPVKPEKPKRSFDDFMNVVMADGNSTVYRHKYQIAVQNGQMHTMNTMIEYHFYDNGKFIDYLTKKNFDELIPKYFSDCDRLIREVQHNRRFKFDDLFVTYKNFCN